MLRIRAGPTLPPAPCARGSLDVAPWRIQKLRIGARTNAAPKDGACCRPSASCLPPRGPARTMLQRRPLCPPSPPAPAAGPRRQEGAERRPLAGVRTVGQYSTCTALAACTDISAEGAAAGAAAAAVVASQGVGTALAAGPLNVPAQQQQLLTQLVDLASKAAGYLVICGSVFLKVPQIVRILKNRSVEGLNVLTFELETLGYTMALAYCVTRKVPFHVYGELFFILAQSLVLMFLLYRYSASKSKWVGVKVALYSVAASLLFFGNLPPQILETIYNFQTTMFTASRLPQMWTNFQAGSTGELSLTSSALSVGGCVARLFTSIHEAAPFSMVLSSIAGLCTHGILLAQILVYQPRNKVGAMIS